MALQRYIGTRYCESLEGRSARPKLSRTIGVGRLAAAGLRAPLCLRQFDLAQFVLVEMELVGALSNHEIQEQLRRLSEKLDLLAAKDAAPRPSARVDRRLRSGLVPEAITRVLSESAEPVRMKDIHAEVERELGQPVSRSAVKNWLAGHTGGKQALFVRLGRGRYVLAPTSTG